MTKVVEATVVVSIKEIQEIITKKK